MGHNTVAVLYNDMLAEIRDRADVGPRLAHSMRAFTWPDSHREAYFGFGQIVSQAHADHDQIVVVGQNRGRRLHECTDLPLLTQEQLADALRLHGWTVKPPRKHTRRRNDDRKPEDLAPCQIEPSSHLDKQEVGG